ncbi:MAG: GerMN domain-containing protein [Treponema sp.]|uniref:GerMN domain-containing protein n=1 Tax=Treponema sp. TaxID=166 RepID=UPI00298D68CD|nr:GerMN domain-containing protein [Treponema sp.]MCQ2600244.1 GerMN domain-containing protein [Treponema sp.]
MIKFDFKNFEYLKKEIKIALFAIVVLLTFSLAAWLISKPGKKYNFRFESVDTGKISVENRYLPRKAYPDNVLQYVDELVLGPETERFKLLFSPGTYIVTSFVRNDVLYVNLSSDVLDRAGSCSEIKTGIELFKTNVLNNFSKINTVEMYIDNKSIYAQSENDE